MLKPKLQCFGHLMQRTDSLEKNLMLGKIESRRRRGHRGWDGSITSPTWRTWVWASSGVGAGEGSLACCSPWGWKELDMTEWLNWTELNWLSEVLSLACNSHWWGRLIHVKNSEHEMFLGLLICWCRRGPGQGPVLGCFPRNIPSSGEVKLS